MTTHNCVYHNFTKCVSSSCFCAKVANTIASDRSISNRRWSECIRYLGRCITTDVEYIPRIVCTVRFVLLCGYCEFMRRHVIISSSFCGLSADAEQSYDYHCDNKLIFQHMEQSVQYINATNKEIANVMQIYWCIVHTEYCWLNANKT